jgi:DNA-binding Xre family transcriptional regulator
MTEPTPTKLGDIFADKSVNQASIARRTGIRHQKLNILATQSTERILADEIYLIALAIGMDPGDLLDLMCPTAEVKKDTKVDGRRKKVMIN